MRRLVLCHAFLIPFAAAGADGGEPKPWVKVTPEVLRAGSVIPRITFEVKMPVEAPAGSVVEIEIPYYFGFPQTEDADADNYLHGKLPRRPKLELSSEEASSRAYVIRAGVTSGKLKKGKKFKLFLTREYTHPFDQKEKAFLTFVKGPPGEDGERPILAEGQTTVVYIPGGPPARLRLVAPTCVTPGEPFAVKVAVLDKNNNPPGTIWEGALSLEGYGVAGPSAAAITAADNDYLYVPGFSVAEPGVYRLNAWGGGLAGRSNPIVCREKWDRRILWGDEQGHSAFSDGMRQPDEFFDYGRYVGLLDVTFLTDHAENLYDDEWDIFVATANAKNEPPAFVTLLAYEWTSDAWSGGYGHRCVFLPGEGGSYYSSRAPNADTPAELWEKYTAGEAVMIPHHTLAGFRWNHYSAQYDRCVEILSHWGCSEYEGNPFWLNREWLGGGVVDALNSYYFLGFVGGGDNHNGAPGQNHAPSRFRHLLYLGGLTAFFVEENSREAIYRALYDRQVYATCGNRDFIDFAVNGAPMASVTPINQGPPLVEAEVATEDALASVEVVRGGETVYAAPVVEGTDYVKFSWRDEGYEGAPTYYYLRVTSEDGHLAYATPIWVSGGAGREINPEKGLRLAAGASLRLPEPPSRDFENYAARLAVVAAAPGELRVVSGSDVLARLETAAGEQNLSALFKTAEPGWDVILENRGPGPLRVREATVFAYPWLEPRWVGRTWTFQAEDSGQTHLGNFVDDAAASGGRALKVSPADNLYETTVLWGPYVALERGEYRAHFYLRAEGDPTSTKATAKIGVAAAPAGSWLEPELVAEKILGVASLASGPTYRKFTLDFTLTEKSKCEFKVIYIGHAIIYVDKIDVQQTSYD